MPTAESMRQTVMSLGRRQCEKYGVNQLLELYRIQRLYDYLFRMTLPHSTCVLRKYSGFSALKSI